MACPDLQRHVLTDHARWQMRRRGITGADLLAVLRSPEQRERVFVDVDRDPPEVVTVYRTSKLEKYWR